MNPIHKVKAPRVCVEPLTPVSMCDIELFLASFDKSWQGKGGREILLRLVDSGIRAAELCALNLAVLELSSGAQEIRQGKGWKPRERFIGR